MANDNLSKIQRLIKHVLIWIVFGYCYQSAVSLCIKMAADAQPNFPLISAFLYSIGFNLLVGHLITKYDNFWPIIGAIFIGVVGLIIVPLVLFGSAGLLDFKLLGGILCSLPICTFIVGLIKQKLSKN
jgi:FtsH-binding integral membrane protein